MNGKRDTDKTPPTDGAIYVYEVTAPGPIKVGQVLAYAGARLRLTQERAGAILAAIPGSLRLIGIP